MRFSFAGLLASVILAGWCAAGAQASPSTGVTIDPGDRPGRLSVTNHGPRSVALRRQVTVEYLQNAVWAVTASEVSLIADCRDKGNKGDLRLASGETFHAAPWNGRGCDGQCPHSCRSNYYLGPGEFRFVVWSAARNQRFEGAPFHLGREESPKDK